MTLHTHEYTRARAQSQLRCRFKQLQAKTQVKMAVYLKKPGVTSEVNLIRLLNKSSTLSRMMQ